MKSNQKKAIGGVAIASTIAAIMAFVEPWEATKNNAYRDIVGVWTICTGRTKNVKQGDYASDEQCAKWLEEEVREYNAGIRQCITRPMKPEQEVSFTSLAYNVGIRGVCESSAIRRFNAGDDSGACDAVLLWNKAGGRVVKGLVNRRNAESVLCKSA